MSALQVRSNERVKKKPTPFFAHFCPILPIKKKKLLNISTLFPKVPVQIQRLVRENGTKRLRQQSQNAEVGLNNQRCVFAQKFIQFTVEMSSFEAVSDKTRGHINDTYIYIHTVHTHIRIYNDFLPCYINTDHFRAPLVTAVRGRNKYTAAEI